MNSPFCVELSAAIPDELVPDVESKLHYVAVEVSGLRIDPINRARITGLIDRPTDQLSQTLSKKVHRVVDSVMAGHVPVETEVYADRSDVAIPAGDNPMEWLERDGHAFALGAGQYGFGPLVGRLMDFFDVMFAEVHASFDPRQYRFPAMISTAAMARCDYFTSFPHSCCFVHHLREDVDVISAFSNRARSESNPSPQHTELADAEFMLAPAVCFHWYHHLAGQTLPPSGSHSATAVGKCFRYESGNLRSLERLWDFSMRELIFVGPGDKVQEQRRKSMEAFRARLDGLGLAYTIESATDPFFVAEYETRTRFQAAFKLKYEIRPLLPYKNGSLAAGSFNYHQDFFGRSFDINVEGAGSAHTACTAIGLERWAFAFLCQFGPDRSGWPREVAEFVATGPITVR